MLKDMHEKKIKISTRRDKSDLQLLFGESAAEAVLRFLDHTAVGKRKEDREERDIDEWDIERLDGSEETSGGERELSPCAPRVQIRKIRPRTSTGGDLRAQSLATRHTALAPVMVSYIQNHPDVSHPRVRAGRAAMGSQEE